MAIINSQTVIACGLSIDIYPLFDPDQVIICPYVTIEKDKIQLIHMNISFDNYNQIIIESNPEIISSPKFLIKYNNNNSFISPSIINKNLTYYLSFSSEFICRFSLLNNELICFYYPISSNFIHIEYHYDEIKYGNFRLSDKSKHRFYLMFIIIIIFIIIICILAIFILCTNRFQLRHTMRLDAIIDSHMAKLEAAKRVPDPQQDGAVGEPLSNEYLIMKETHGLGGDG